jgi:hypothetical protein
MLNVPSSLNSGNYAWRRLRQVCATKQRGAGDHQHHQQLRGTIVVGKWEGAFDEKQAEQV